MSDFGLFDDLGSDRPPTLEEERPARRRPRRPARRDTLYNLVSALFMLMTLAVVGVTLLFTQEQFVYSALNPWPPQLPPPTPTLFVLPEIPSATRPVETEPLPAPTETPSPTLTVGAPTQMSTPGTTPTAGTPPGDLSPTPTTPPGESTPTPMTPPIESSPTVSIHPFTLQDEAVTYTENMNEEGCAWQSIAGQVLGLEGEPIVGLAVQVIGENFEQIEFTGSMPEFGDSGYEVWLNNTPLEAEYQIQLLNTTGQPLSEVIIVRTLSACDKNVAIVNFVQNHPYVR